MIINLLNIDEVEVIDFKPEFNLDDLKKAGILKMNEVNVTGEIRKLYEDYELELNIIGSMDLPCSVSLKPVNYPFNIKISDFLNNLVENYENTLDIFPIIWENILMEIPIRIVSPDIGNVKTCGNGWKVITELEEQANPELEKLKDLL